MRECENKACIAHRISLGQYSQYNFKGFRENVCVYFSSIPKYLYERAESKQTFNFKWPIKVVFASYMYLSVIYSIYIHSENRCCVWIWKVHSELAAMSFPFSNKNKMFNENVHGDIHKICYPKIGNF